MLSLFISWLYLPPIIRFVLLSLTFGLLSPCSEALYAFKVDWGQFKLVFWPMKVGHPPRLD